MDGLSGHFAHPGGAGFVERVVEHGQKGINLKTLPVLANHLARERWAGKNCSGDGLPCTVRRGDEIVVDEVDHHVELKLAPVLLDSWIMKFVATGADGIRAKLLLKSITLVRCVAVVILRVDAILHDAVLLPEPFGENGIGMADVVKVNAGKLRNGGEFANGSLHPFAHLGAAWIEELVVLDVGGFCGGGVAERVDVV